MLEGLDIYPAFRGYYTNSLILERYIEACGTLLDSRCHNPS